MKILERARAIHTSSMPKEEKKIAYINLSEEIGPDHDWSGCNGMELGWLLELGHLYTYDIMSLELEDKMTSWDDGSLEVTEELQRLHEQRKEYYG